MHSKVIFIHIPKCAGSSLSYALVTHFGRDKSYLIGKDCPHNQIFFPRKDTAEKDFVSGHKGVEFYKSIQSPLFISIIRDPVSRALSLYNYYTQPENAETEDARIIREDLFSKWRRKGMDQNSLRRSIEKSPQFRYEISNAQCRYLSISNKNWFSAAFRHYLSRKSVANFDSALATINSHRFLIGTQKEIHSLTVRLSETLKISALEIGRLNTSKDFYVDSFDRDDESIELIMRLNIEDQKLYQYIENQHDSVFDHSH